MKKVTFLLFFFFSVLFTPTTFAADNSFVSIINPVRGDDFWDIKNQKPDTAVSGQIEILNKFNLPATWLLRFDALNDKKIIDEVKKRPADEKGLFLEITSSLTKEAGVEYRQSGSWHSAGSAFLTGYERRERGKLIDTIFEKFKNIFGVYPVSVGAWWIDSYSLGYMQKKYGIISDLIVADQYSTDNYQIWGQYFSTPFYPSKNNALHPAQTPENKIDVVTVQWAARDPVNSYGNGVSESTFSVQANDYLDYHQLDTKYFSKLVDIYTKQEFNQFGFLVVGLENSYQWNKYSGEYEKQMETLNEKRSSSQFSVVPMKDFAIWYQKNFPKLSPWQIIIADDPLGSFKKTVWFMDPYYRAGWFVNSEGSVFRDIRQYVDGEEEICFQVRCDSVNFATSATRVLDEVSFGHKWIIDEGKIKNFKVSENGEKVAINYLNEANTNRAIEFLPRDISVNGKISSIDEAILNAIKQDTVGQKNQPLSGGGSFNWSPVSVLLKIIKFVLFLILTCLIPGIVYLNKLFEKDTPFLKKFFLSIVTGFVSLTIIFYFTSLLNLRFLIYAYLLINLVLFFKFKLFNVLKPNFHKVDKLNLGSLLVVSAGLIFQTLPTFKSGLVFPFGMGFWGPNTHDGVWHISLINQLVKTLPVENPIFAGSILKNYHFFYDLLVAGTVFLTKIPALDLVFRFYPIIFSLLLGIGTYYLVFHLFAERIGSTKTKIVVIFSLYFVYFTGSFGWIVEYIKQRHLGGESAFWANQSISFNLNPPFAISLLVIIVILLMLTNKKIVGVNKIIILVLLTGSLIGFKTYGAILVITTLLLISALNIFKKEFSYTLVTTLSVIVSLVIFIPNFQPNQQLVMFSPFWFINSMIDSPDRVGWYRLSLTRIVGLQTGNWFKFITAEIVSLVLFIFGNLGIRFLSFFSLTKIKQIFKDDNLLFLLIFSFLSILTPILFVQSGNPWNTIQFLYYGLYITAIINGLVLTFIIFKLPKLFSVVILLLVIILTPINSITTATSYISYLPHARISDKELEALQFLSKQKDGVVLTYPYDEKLKQKIAEPWPLFAYDSTAYVSALSDKAVYLEDESQNQILLTDYKKRLVASHDFFQNPTLGQSFLEENGIRYIYIPKIINVRLDEGAKIKNIFENEEVIIYEAIK